MIAPDLTRELELTPASLGLLTSAYFLAFAAVQSALERLGSDRTQAIETLIRALANARLAGTETNLIFEHVRTAGLRVEVAMDPRLQQAAETAVRELEEETGYRAGRVEHLITFQPMVGMVDSEHVVFTGRDPEKVGEPTETAEVERMEWVPLASVPGLVADRRRQMDHHVDPAQHLRQAELLVHSLGLHHRRHQRTPVANPRPNRRSVRVSPLSVVFAT